MKSAEWKRQRNARGNTEAAGIGGIVGIVILMWFGSQAAKMGASKHWPAIIGEVVSIEPIITAKYANGHTYGHPRVFYHYSVDKKPYAGQFEFTEETSSTKNIWVDRFYQHKQILVYYNTGNPQESVLVQGYAMGWPTAFAIFGLVLAASCFGYAALHDD